MTTYTLLLLALPLLVCPWLVPLEESGRVTAQLAIAAVGLAALWRAMGTLDPSNLRVMARATPDDAWFVAVTVGAALSGGCVLPSRGRWRQAVCALPLAAGLVASTTFRPAALLLGAVIGALPSLGTLLPARSAAAHGSDPGGVNSVQLIAALVAIGAALAGPMLLCVAALVVLVWEARPRQRQRTIPLQAIIATGSLVVWSWLALTIAGAPLIRFSRFAIDAPVSDAAGVLLAFTGLLWILAVAAPFPFERRTVPVVILPVLAVVLSAWTPTTLAGVLHWQPLLTTLLTAAAIAAAAAGRWEGALAALVVLSGTRTGMIGVAGAVAAGSAVLVGRVTSAVRMRLLLAGIAAALTVGAVLADEVFLAVMLALGLGFFACAERGVVARRGAAVHL